MERVVDEAEALAELELLDRFDRIRLVAQRALLEAERLDQPHDAGVLQDRRERAQRRPQPLRPFWLRQAVVGVVDRAQHQRLRAAALRIAGECRRLAGARVVPVVEALQRVDREDAHAGSLRLGPHPLGRGAVAHRHAVQIVADLDLIEPERGRQLQQAGEAAARRHHVIEGVADDVFHLACSP